MKKIRFLLIVFINLSIVFAFNPNNYCTETHLKCTGSYNSMFAYKESCKKLKCHGKFSFECSNICSRSQTDCTVFLNYLSWLQSFGMLSKKQFMSSISKCPKNLYILNKSDLCRLEEMECLLRKNSFWVGSKYEKVKCPFPKKYRYECGPSYCALDSDVCRAFTTKNITLETIQYCHKSFGDYKNKNRGFYEKIF